MPLLGAHESIGGGLHMAFERILKVRGEALQIFTKNERQWRAKPITDEARDLFRRAHRETGLMPVASHDSYLINLAATDKKKLRLSIEAFTDEIDRAGILGIPFLVSHPGSHLGRGVSEGLKQFTANLDRAIEASSHPGVTVLIESTAGQGTNLGSTFEEVAYILGKSRYPERLAVCLDTCHIFAAGYDIRTPETHAKTMSLFDAAVGLDRVKFFHLNDAKGELGSRIDRHEHIGKGKIGLEGFRLLLNDPRFAGHPMVLETKKGPDLAEDAENLRVLRSLIKG